MKWDCEIGGQPFLFSTNQQNQYRRETAEFRRQRIDNDRNPGEQSLDSGYWLRSQASWHLGAGLPSAEPLESSEAEAQFRFQDSRGIDPWTPGQLSLHKTIPAYKTGRTTAWACGAIMGTTGIFSWHGTSLYYDTSTTSYTPTFVGTGTAVNGAAACGTGATIAYITDSQVVIGSPVGTGTFAVQYNGGSYLTLIGYVKGRLLVGDGRKLHEITNLAPGSPPVALPTAMYTHTESAFQFEAIAEGPAAVYLGGWSSLSNRSSIYSMTATDAGGAVTLGALVERAQLPSGEHITWMESYLGAYLVIASSAGYRVALINNDGSITLGPILVEAKTGWPEPYGITFRGRYAYVANASMNDPGPSLYRIDLGAPFDDGLRFPVAADMCVKNNAGTAHDVTGVLVDSNTDRIVVCVRNEGLYRESTGSYETSGWLTTGRIRMGTLESKAWLEGRVTVQAGTTGQAQIRVSTTGSGAVSTWSLIATATSGSPDVTGSMATAAPTPSQELYVGLQLSGGQAVTTGFQIKALPAPKRSRLIQVPIQMWDYEKDRNGNTTGHDGYAWERLSALETMEKGSGLVGYVDHTTGESVTAYIERVTFSRITPPSRGSDNAGGVAQVLLRVV